MADDREQFIKFVQKYQVEKLLKICRQLVELGLTIEQLNETILPLMPAALNATVDKYLAGYDALMTRPAQEVLH